MGNPGKRAGQRADWLHKLVYNMPANHMYRYDTYVKSRKTYTHAEAVEVARTMPMPNGKWVSVGEIYHILGNDP